MVYLRALPSTVVVRNRIRWCAQNCILPNLEISWMLKMCWNIISSRIHEFRHDVLDGLNRVLFRNRHRLIYSSLRCGGYSWRLVQSVLFGESHRTIWMIVFARRTLFLDCLLYQFILDILSYLSLLLCVCVFLINKILRSDLRLNFLKNLLRWILMCLGVLWGSSTHWASRRVLYSDTALCIMSCMVACTDR